ncbi:MAG: sigma-70 family RNA polymerase sigma factor [Ruminococcaceae bacterium]|nr:sigma-70 family RNA polymerase sigma factor [Oscillospiraceae bacterium]
MTEKKIIAELKDGSTDGLCMLISRYTAYVSAIVYRIIGKDRREDCEELMSDIFVTLWCNRYNVRENKVKEYIGTIARNKAYNFVRSRKEELPLDEEILFGGDDPQSYTEKKDTGVMLKNALLQLDPQKKELMLRYYFYGQKLNEAAKDMNISNSAAKSRLKRGREELRSILRKEGFEL